MRYAIDPSGAGKGLFFSYDADLTLSQQQYDKLAAGGKLENRPLYDRTDPRFFFNRQLVLPLLGTRPAQPIPKFAHQLHTCEVPKKLLAHICL